MSDFARLKEKLGKLRQVETRTGAGRALSGHDATSRLRAVLVEIDETILPRRITFKGPAGQVAVGAANRQLSLILEGAVRETQVPHVIDGRDDPVLAELHDGLVQLLAQDGPWDVTTSRLDRVHVGHMRPDAAVGAQTLSTIWNLGSLGADAEADAGDVVRRFIDRAGPRCDAWLLIEGEEIAESGGSAQAISWLSERAGGFLDGFYARRDIFPHSEPLALAFSGGTGASVVYFECGDQAGFATVRPDRLSGALDDWTRSLT